MLQVLKLLLTIFLTGLLTKYQPNIPYSKGKQYQHYVIYFQSPKNGIYTADHHTCAFDGHLKRYSTSTTLRHKTAPPQLFP